MRRVFLGGTCNESTWRDEMMDYLYAWGVEYFNPVVDDWNDEAYKNELREREICDYCLYTITPKMTGVYSIAEVVDDSNKRPEKTVFVVLEEAGEVFTDGQMRSLKAVATMVEKNGGKSFNDLKSASKFIIAD
jgi:hypothetical protein